MCSIHRRLGDTDCRCKLLWFHVHFLHLTGMDERISCSRSYDTSAFVQPLSPCHFLGIMFPMSSLLDKLPLICLLSVFKISFYCNLIFVPLQSLFCTHTIIISCNVRFQRYASNMSVVAIDRCPMHLLLTVYLVDLLGRCRICSVKICHWT